MKKVKNWVLVSPDGKKYQVDNLPKWAGENYTLFEFDPDVKPEDAKIRITQGLRGITKGRSKQYKGWTVMGIEPQILSCKKCGKQFAAEYSVERYFCEDCVKQSKQNSVLRPRTCKTCGVTFTGGPRAWYCPDCRTERQKKASVDYQRRKRSGVNRKLGSTDFCENCGGEYTVESSKQKYCPNCAEEAVKNVVSSQKKIYNKENRAAITKRRQGMRPVNQAECKICGKTFIRNNTSVTCSDACAKELHRIWQSEADIKRGKRRLPADQRYDSGLPKSGVVGVTWHRQNKRWQATYKSKYLGCFDSVDLAAKRIEEEREKRKDETKQS